jgi:hypothetical protein
LIAMRIGVSRAASGSGRKGRRPDLLTLEPDRLRAALETLDLRAPGDQVEIGGCACRCGISARAMRSFW